MSSKYLLWTGSACVFLAALVAAIAFCLQAAIWVGTIAVGAGANVLVAIQWHAAATFSAASTVGLMASPVGHNTLLADAGMILSVPVGPVGAGPIVAPPPDVLYAGLQWAAIPLGLGLGCFCMVVRRRWRDATP